MKIAKHLFSSLLGLAVLLVVAPEASAQRVFASTHSLGRAVTVTSRVWIPGRYETIHERVWVPGWSERVWIEPVFEWRIDPCGRRVRVQLCAGYWKTVHRPGHYETRAVRVYRPGHWASRGPCN